MSHMRSRKNSNANLASALPGLVRDKGWEQKIDQHRVFLDWEKLVDETTAAHCRPLKVLKDVLWLEVENSAWMQQLQFQKVTLLQVLNDYLKFSRFSDIRFAVQEKQRQEPPARRAALRFVAPAAEQVEEFEKMISCIEDEPIRSALMRLWYISQACRKDDQ